MFDMSIDTVKYSGYVPYGLGIGGGDYMNIRVCLDCGQLQGAFPLPISEIEQDCIDEDLRDFFDENFSEGEFFRNIPINKQTRILEYAEELNFRLHLYIKDVFDCYCGAHSDTQVPSTDGFIKAYKKGSLEL